ncbi:hypothetical protein Acr_11g0007160 [Actinidia rufa]|uniref:Uncharacterized protein n=1 Tax=Actinidia rufa TaxID=165716 RepID=A0A7J0FCI4_9ERIC|nr:hypothetical protein Acr_11g0007160 [Actinidia rufa]
MHEMCYDTSLRNCQPSQQLTTTPTFNSGSAQPHPCAAAALPLQRPCAAAALAQLKTTLCSSLAIPATASPCCSHTTGSHPRAKTVLFFSDPPPSPGLDSEIFAEDDPIPPRPLPILEPPPPSPNGSLPSIIPTNLSPHAQAPLPASSPKSAYNTMATGAAHCGCYCCAVAAVWPAAVGCCLALLLQ